MNAFSFFFFYSSALKEYSENQTIAELFRCYKFQRERGHQVRNQYPLLTSFLPTSCTPSDCLDDRRRSNVGEVSTCLVLVSSSCSRLLINRSFMLVSLLIRLCTLKWYCLEEIWEGWLVYWLSLRLLQLSLTLTCLRVILRLWDTHWDDCLAWLSMLLRWTSSRLPRLQLSIFYVYSNKALEWSSKGLWATCRE